MQPGTLAEESVSRLNDQDLTWLCEKLGPCAYKWRLIAQGLGFTDHELCNIEAAPLLLTGAPYSYLQAMLSRWLQWAPGDSRGSKCYASKECLRGAVNKAGMGQLAQEL